MPNGAGRADLMDNSVDVGTAEFCLEILKQSNHDPQDPMINIKPCIAIHRSRKNVNIIKQ